MFELIINNNKINKTIFQNKNYNLNIFLLRQIYIFENIPVNYYLFKKTKNIT